MRIRLLGPVQIGAVGDDVLEVGPPQRRVVLAALAVDAGRLVAQQTLINRVWAEKPPRRADRTLHTHLSHLRRLLAQAGAAGADPVRLIHRTGGYLLHIDPDQVDVHRFRRLAKTAADADQPVAARVARWRETVGLWRGEPLAGLPGDWTERTRTAWHREYRDAVLGWAYAEIQTHNPTVVIGPLTELIGRYEVDEAVPVKIFEAGCSGFH
jgi:DNA-binding SARP family transcriptional activator